MSNRVKGGEGIKGYNEETMNTIKLGKLAKDLNNSLHFIKFFDLLCSRKMTTQTRVK